MSTLSLLDRDLSTYELRVLSDQHVLQYAYHGVIIKGDKPQNINVNVLLDVSVNPDPSTFLKFSVKISDFVKTESPFKDSKGKYIKMLSEFYKDSLVYSISNKFEINIIHDNTSIFLNQTGYLNNSTINTRAELAKIFLTSIELGNIELIKYSNNIPIIGYDTTCLILIELLKIFKLESFSYESLNDIKKTNWQKINQIELLQAILNARHKLVTELKIPCIDGTLLHKLSEVALKIIETKIQETKTTKTTKTTK